MVQDEHFQVRELFKVRYSTNKAKGEKSEKIHCFIFAGNSLEIGGLTYSSALNERSTSTIASPLADAISFDYPKLRYSFLRRMSLVEPPAETMIDILL